MTSERRGTRRERTFVGSECAVCEEPLEHTLRGERILQFSCSHVSHEACFYEFIKEIESQYCPTCNAPLHLDTSRGGNVLDIGEDDQRHRFQTQGATADWNAAEKISNMVRSVSVNDSRSQGTRTPTQPWDDQTLRPPSHGSNARSGGMQMNGRETSQSQRRPARDSAPLSDRYTTNSRHARSDSEATGIASSGGYPETTQSGPARRHDYDVQAMETSLTSPRASARNPIPPPSVTVKSEFPTISRSRQQQTLTCLVTIEVPDSNWRPDPEDLQAVPATPLPRPEETYAAQQPRPPSSPARTAPRFYPYESPEVLQDMTDNLRSRVDNWHGLDFSR